MDLYKWAFKLAPYPPAELVADCFELALVSAKLISRQPLRPVRVLGFEPIPIETAAGRADYEAKQRSFAERGEPFCGAADAVCERLLAL